jgi:hypothetical protein
MPGVIGAAVAVATFPVNLSTKFVETHTVLANLNEYSDGSSQRKSLVLGGRRSWKLAKRLVPAEMVQLRTFWEDTPRMRSTSTTRSRPSRRFPAHPPAEPDSISFASPATGSKRTGWRAAMLPVN